LEERIAKRTGLKYTAIDYTSSGQNMGTSIQNVICIGGVQGSDEAGTAEAR
jgi:hypothetical protein